jgi:hypothetical protein
MDEQYSWMEKWMNFQMNVGNKIVAKKLNKRNKME